MATNKQKILTTSKVRWKHLRDFKKFFWKRERKAEDREVRREISDSE